MDYSASVFWWVATGVVVAAELATGTFYLLMIALGTAAAAVAAHLGVSGSAQLVVAAVVGCGTTGLWHGFRSRQPPAPPAAVNPDIHLDIGERVLVAEWSAERTTRVAHRGTTWSARLQAGAPAAPGEHTVQAVEGNALVLAPASIRS